MKVVDMVNKSLEFEDAVDRIAYFQRKCNCVIKITVKALDNHQRIDIEPEIGGKLSFDTDTSSQCLKDVVTKLDLELHESLDIMMKLIKLLDCDDYRDVYNNTVFSIHAKASCMG